jgi:hypothetical protein
MDGLLLNTSSERAELRRMPPYRIRSLTVPIFGMALALGMTASANAATPHHKRAAQLKKARSAAVATPTLANLALINADTDKPISAFTPLANGTTLNLATLPTRRLNMEARRANTAVRSVAFYLDGVRVRVQNATPFSLGGDNGTDFYPWTPSLGTHTVKAKPYSGANLTGTDGPTLSLTFNVTSSGSTTPTPTPTPAPTPAPTPTPAPAPAPTPDPTPAPTPAPDPTPAPSVGLSPLLSSDMTLGSEAMPDGFTGDWAYKPRAKTNLWRTGQYTHIMPWGTLYQEQGGNHTAAKANVADLQAWAGYDDGSWYRVKWNSGAPAGSQGNLFPENWINANGTVTPGGGSISATTQQLGDGSTTVRLGDGSPNPLGYLYHFWSQGRFDLRTAPKPLSSLARVVITLRARIDPATYNPNAKYVLATGADRWGPNGENGWDAVIGRFKKVDANWRLYTATLGTVSPSNLPGPITGVQSAGEYR